MSVCTSTNTKTKSSRLTVLSILAAATIGASYSFSALASSDILLYNINEQGQVLKDSKIKVTDRPGYDNQPFFSRDSKGLFYTQMSKVMGQDQTDIVYYDFANGSHTNLTRTVQTSEYSPTEIPNSDRLSVIKVETDGTQRLWTINKKTGQQALLNRHIKPVGYHAWGKSGEIAMFVLGEPMTLQIIDSANAKKAKKLADDIGPSIRYSQDLDLFTYTVNTDQGHQLRTYRHNSSEKASTQESFIHLPKGSQYYTLFDDTTVITADGSELVTWSIKGAQAWQPLVDLSDDCPTSISRIAVSQDARQLAVVCNEPAK